MNVLVVDDSDTIRRQFYAVLGHFPFVDRVWLSENTTAAWSVLRSEPPDLILLDLYLDGRPEGLNFLKLVKTRADAPVVWVLSNYPEYRETVLAAGADRFFDKTLEFDKLVAALSDWHAEPAAP